MKISGDNQEGSPAQALANPFVIEVHDGTGIPLVGVTARFTVLRGGGSLSATALSTNSDGRAASALTLGRVAGTKHSPSQCRRYLQDARLHRRRNFLRTLAASTDDAHDRLRQ